MTHPSPFALTIDQVLFEFAHVFGDHRWFAVDGHPRRKFDAVKLRQLSRPDNKYEGLRTPSFADGVRSPLGTASSQVEAVQVHDLVPRRHEVVHELPARIVLCVDLCQGT